MDRYQLRLIGRAEPAALRRALDSTPPTLDRNSFKLVPPGTSSPFIASSDKRLPLDRLQTVLQIQGIETVVIDSSKQSASPKPTVAPRQVSVSEEALAKPIRESSLLEEFRERIWLVLGIVGAAAVVVVLLLIFGGDYTPALLTAADSTHPRKIEIEAHLDGVHLTAHEPAPSGAGGGDPAAVVGGASAAGETHIHVAMGGAAAGTGGATGVPGAPVQQQDTPAQAAPAQAGGAPPAARPQQTAPRTEGAGRTAPPSRPAAAGEAPAGPDTELSVRIDASGTNTITIAPGEQSAAPLPPPPPPLPPPEPPKPDRRGLVPAFALGLLLALAVRWVWLAWRPRPRVGRPGWVARLGAVASLWAAGSAGAWVVITRPPDAQLVTLPPAAPLKLVASLSGDHHDGDAGAAVPVAEPPAAASNGHRPGAFTRFFARMHTKPAEKSGQRPFHKLLKAMHTKQAAEKIRATAQTDWQQALPPPGSRRTLPAASPARRWLAADVQALWHAGAPADSHEHECVPSPLARARASELERAHWSYLVGESETVEAAGDGGVAAPDLAGLSLHADVDIPAEAAAAGRDATQETPAAQGAPAAAGRGPRKATTIVMPFGQPPPPEVAGLQGAPDKPEPAQKPKRHLPPVPPPQPEPPSATMRLFSLLAGFTVGSIGGLFLRPRREAT